MKRNAPATGVECPECGGHQTAVCNSHRDEEGNRIRLRGCTECGHYFGTVEVHVPGFSFHRAKASRDRWQRTTREYIKVHRSDKSVKLTVIPAVAINRCRRGLHEMAGENIGYNGRNRSKRYCRACKRQHALVNYHYGRQHAPESIKEDQRTYWREQKRKQAERAA